MKLLRMFEIGVEHSRGEQTLLVVAANAQEARELARPRGRVKSINAEQGAFAVRGGSRVVGEVELELLA